MEVAQIVRGSSTVRHQLERSVELQSEPSKERNDYSIDGFARVRVYENLGESTLRDATVGEGADQSAVLPESSPSP